MTEYNFMASDSIYEPLFTTDDEDAGNLSISFRSCDLCVTLCVHMLVPSMNGNPTSPSLPSIIQGSRGYKFDVETINDHRLKMRLIRNRVYAWKSAQKKRIKEAEEDQRLAQLLHLNAELRGQMDGLQRKLEQSKVCSFTLQ